MTLLDDYLSDCRIRGLSALTIADHEYILSKFLSKTDPLHIERSDIRNYIDIMRKNGLRYGTIAHRISILASLYEYLIFEGLISENPVRPIAKRYMVAYKADGGRQIKQIITIEEAARLVNSAVDIRDC